MSNSVVFFVSIKNYIGGTFICIGKVGINESFFKKIERFLNMLINTLTICVTSYVNKVINEE